MQNTMKTMITNSSLQIRATAEIALRLRSHVPSRHYSQPTGQQNRPSKANNGTKNTLPTASAAERRQIVQGDLKHPPSASNTSEAISILNNRLKQGNTVSSHTFVELLKLCSNPKNPTAAKQVHECIVKCGMDKNPHVASTLLNVYIKCGRLRDARRVFDELGKKSVITWNIMIGGYAKNDHPQHALEVFDQMRRGGVKPDEITYLSILKACARSPSPLKCGKEVHSHIRQAGLESDVRVGTALIQMYAKCGGLEEARQVFETLTNRNVITWNVMFSAYAKSGCDVEAYELFLQMKREGFKANAVTYMIILNAVSGCPSTAGLVEWVKEVHLHILEIGFEINLGLENALILAYAKSGSIGDARLVFDRMKERNVITWNVLIGVYAKNGSVLEARELFHKMRQEGFKPDVITYTSVLNALSSGAGGLEWVKEVHFHILESQLKLDLWLGNALVHAYSKSGSIGDARLVFDGMKERDVITWNTMINAYAENGSLFEARQHFLRMKEEGFKPDAITFASILNGNCSNSPGGGLEWVKDVHSHVREAGLESNPHVGRALVTLYTKIGRIDDAQLVFNRMKDHNVITWTAMIGGLTKNSRGRESYDLFLQMQREGCVADVTTYVSILNARSSTAGTLEWVKEVHRHAAEAGFGSDLRINNSLIHMYAKCGSIDDARSVFHLMEERNVITWTATIGGLAQHGFGREALNLFINMNADGVNPNGHTFAAVLSACSHSGLLFEGRELFRAMTEDYGIEPTVQHYTCMVDLLARAGHLQEAKEFIVEMPIDPDEATWGALLGGCRTYGNVELGELIAKEVLRLEPQDASTYVMLSNIYAAAGKWDMVGQIRTMMLERGIRKKPGRSWIEVDGKIHDFVVGDLSHPEADEIYAELSRLTERIKAEGYVPDTQLVLRNIDEEDKELSLCSHSEKLAIVYGLMRIPDGKPIHVYKNLRVCSDCHAAIKVISKVTGREIVTRDGNRFHQFKDGVCSCGDYW